MLCDSSTLASVTSPPPSTVDEADLALLDTIAQLQRHLDALALTNACLVSQLESARSNATQVQERVGRARDDDADCGRRKASRQRLAEAPCFDDDEQVPAMHRGVDSLGSSVATSDAAVVDDCLPAYRSYGALATEDDAEFDAVEVAAEAPQVTYRSCSTFGGVDEADLLAAAQFDLDVLRDAVDGLGKLAPPASDAQSAAPPSDESVSEQLAKLSAAMRAYLVL